MDVVRIYWVAADFNSEQFLSRQKGAIVAVISCQIIQIKIKGFSDFIIREAWFFPLVKHYFCFVIPEANKQLS